MQNGVHTVHHPSQGQTAGSRRVPDLGCEQDGEEQPTPIFCYFLTCAHAGMRLGIVVKEKDVFHVSDTTNSTDALLQFV
jgi:hypothetical protein